MQKKPLIVWFQQDLRLEANRALWEAAQSGQPLLPLYIFDEVNLGKWKKGGASRWWLHHSLKALDAELRKRGSQLCLFRGDPLEILPHLMHKLPAVGLYWNRCYEPYAQTLEKKLKKILPESQSFQGNLLIEPTAILNEQKEFFKVYTPFWRKCLKIISLEKPCVCPPFATYPLQGEKLEEWKLLPEHPNWALAFPSFWEVGEKAAQKKLQRFVEEKLPFYEEGRDFPAVEGTSTLSPHLHFGEISPQQILYAVKDKESKFVSELGWREFCYSQLVHFPDLPSKPWRAEFSRFPWEKNSRFLHAWQQGETGFPLVDAGMRQLWKQGWMHNRVRMVVASFLVKDLFLPWQDGESWFWDTLVDADLANNAANWQWVAGCGFDAAPFFRIFNPELQAKKFDPEGSYIRRWIPELAKVPTSYIHQPHLSGLRLSYPLPIVNHEECRKKALIIFSKLK